MFEHIIQNSHTLRSDNKKNDRGEEGKKNCGKSICTINKNGLKHAFAFAFDG